MKHPQYADSSPDGGQAPFKSSIPPTSSPSAHPSMAHHVLSEHPDPAQHSTSPSDFDVIPIYPSDLTLSLFSPSSLSFLVESPPSLCYSPPQVDRALSNLPGPSAPFDAACPDGAPASLTDKGKAKEPPPTLPPLQLSPTRLDYNIDDWSSIPGPSSYRSTCPSVRTGTSSDSPSSSVESTIVHADELPTPSQVPSRTRSLSNLSIHSTTPSMSKIRIKLAASSKAPANLARRLLSRNKATAGPSVTGPENDVADLLGDDLVSIETGNCLFPWQSKDITRASSPRAGVEVQVPPVVAPDLAAILYPDNHRLDGLSASPRTKHRSSSSPLPKSAFDVVPQVDFGDRFIPLPLHARDLFDEMLPRELRLRVFSALVSLHETDHEQLEKSGKWTVLVASSSKNRWVGRHRGMRELVKLSRVGIVDSCPIDPVNQS